ncbi:MAG: DUF1343 domain-containing protein [Bacteroidales bacterium]|nr:DUF1343 domain-containing protein [Bacteroidales bacterium]
MKLFKLALAAITLLFAASTIQAQSPEVVMGAARTDTYVPLLKGKRIALLSNMTGMVGNKHTLDIMIENGLDVTTIFSPEHGFRGTADAGEKVSSSVDSKTGIPIASLYDGKSKRPSKETMSKFDVIVVDIQDVGLRFYTYYITMVRLMEAAAQYDKEFVVMDRPNPNGMYIDGPMLDMKHRSGVGRLPIPVVHGLTMGEIALMANGEGWLDDSLKVKHLTVVKCLNYTHQTRYRLPIAPSPNLPNMTSIYLYPSTCLFEGTSASLGRGTDKPFQVYGHPAMKGKGYKFSFTPKSVPGAKNPPQLGNKCYGRDLSKLSDEEIIAKGMNLEYVIDAYRGCGLGDKFFTSFFELLTGDDSVRQMIEAGKSNEEIKATWAPGLKKFEQLRRRYLIYAE